MLKLLHRKIMADNIKWDSCSPGQKWVNTLLLMALVWFLLSSTSPMFATFGMVFFTYLIVVRVWYFIFILLWAWSLPPKEEEEKEEEKEKDEGEHYLLEKRKEKEEKEEK